MEATPRFLNGIYPFEGQGYDKPSPISEKLAYAVPPDKRAQLIYMRAGNSSSDLIYLMLMRDGQPMRYFPLGAKNAEHVPLAVVEDLFPETKLELLLAAPSGATGHLILDIGILEV